VVSNLLSRPDAPTPKTKGGRQRRPSLESTEQVPVPNDVTSVSQRPPAPKKVRDDHSHGARRKQPQAAPTINSRAPGEAEFKRVSSGTTHLRSGKQHSKKSGVSSPADLNPRKHGVQPVSLISFPAKTVKVSRGKSVATSAAQGQGSTSVKSAAAPSVDRQAFLARRVDLMGPVTDFGDRVGYLPSLPASASLPSRTLGHNHALVEIVL